MGSAGRRMGFRSAWRMGKALAEARLASELEASMREVAKGSEELRGVVGSIAS